MIKKYKSIIKEGKEMNKWEAEKLDLNRRGKIEVYIEEEDGTEYVFGLNSGFAYASPSFPEDWIEEQHNMVLI